MACDSQVISKTFVNAEYERKKELDRRRKLRLLQVRQQSKDFSHKLRETIQAEALKKRKAALKCTIQTIQEKQMEELKRLKDMYGECLQNVGSGHKEAAKQPNINLIKELEAANKSKEADIRGVKARKEQLAEKNLQYQKIHALIEQKRETRNRENMRSFYVSCLPKQSSKHKKSARSPKKDFPRNLESQENLEVLTKVPSNLIIPQTRSSCTRDNKDTGLTVPSNNSLDHLGQTSKGSCVKVVQCPSKLHEDIPPLSVAQNECSCDYVVCSCHLKKQIRRRYHSESSISSEHTSEAKKPKLRSHSCSPQSVRTLNYCSVGNVYESKEPNFATVEHHPKQSDSKLKGPDPSTLNNLVPHNNDKNEDLSKKTEDRCLKAQQREQLKKDFLQLLKDLKNVNREKLVARSSSKTKTKVYQRERDILTKKESKQKKLADAFETLLHTAKHSRIKSKSLTQVHQPSLDSSSPPTLNLATYQQIYIENVSQPKQVLSTEEGTLLATPHVSCNNLSTKMSEHYVSGCRSPEEEQHYKRHQSPPRRQQSMINVKMKETDCLRPVCRSKKSQRSDRSPDSGTSYCSLPENLTPSQEQLLNELLSQVKKKSLNPKLKIYIQKLLNMSRESIENLPTSPQTDRARSSRSSPCVNIEESMRRAAELINDYADRLNDLVNTFEVMENCASPLHMNLPEHIPRDLPRRPPSPIPIPTTQSPPLDQKKTQFRVPSPLLSETSELPSGNTVDNPPISEIRQIPTPPEYSRESSPSSIQNSVFRPRRDQSPLRRFPCRMEDIQSPFGLSSNLLPNPKDLFGQRPTSPQPQIQQTLSRISESPEDQMRSSCLGKSDGSPDREVISVPGSRPAELTDEGSDSHDDSYSWAYAGLPRPPTWPPREPSVDENVLFMEKLGHLPGEGSQLDLSNLSLEMQRIGVEFDKIKELEISPQARPVIASSTPLRSPNFIPDEAWSSQSPTNYFDEDDQATEVYYGIEVCNKSSPLNVDSIMQRISNICSEHCNRFLELLSGESDEETRILVNDICKKPNLY